VGPELIANNCLLYHKPFVAANLAPHFAAYLQRKWKSYLFLKKVTRLRLNAQ